MKLLPTALSLAAVLAVAACNQQPNTAIQTDTGNMAYPTPRPAGQIGITSTSGQGAAQGYLAPSPGYADTGNMALPNRAQGYSVPRN